MRTLLALVLTVEVLGAQELPKSGTLGDLPPEKHRVSVTVLSDGTIRLGDAELGFPALREKLRACKPETDVLLRIDRRVPWIAVQWLMTACAEAKLARVFHAVRPEEGEETGALALFLPKDRGLSPTPQEPPRFVQLPVWVVARPKSVPLEQLYPIMRKLVGRGETVVLDLKAAHHTPYEICIRICDLALRAGIEHILFYGTQVPPRDGDLKKLVASAREPKDPRTGRKRPAAFGIMLAGRELAPAEEPGKVPAGKRVRGGIAGIPRSDASPLFDEEEEEEVPAEEVEESEEIEEIVEHGKADRTSDRVDRALKWLAAHQDEDGRWDCDGFQKHDEQGKSPGGPGAAQHDVGVTGLAALAFLGANYTDRESRRFRNPYAKTVRKALRFLIASQREDGHLGPAKHKRHVYDHAIATLALCQAYAYSRNPRYKKPAQEGLDHLALARNPFMAWRYDARGGEDDTSVTAWCLLATHGGRFAGLDTDPDAYEGARQWFVKMIDPKTGRAGYRERGKGAFRPDELKQKYPADSTRAPSAAALAGRLMHGYPARDELVQKLAGVVAALPPKWETDRIDLAYWYWGTFSLRGLKGDAWKAWSASLQEALKQQRDDGSWDPVGVWGSEGGRVYSTALLAICAEHVALYDRAFHVK